MHFLVNNRKSIISVLLWVTPVLLFFISFVSGRYPIALTTVIQILFSSILPLDHFWTPMAENVVFQVRLPRILAATVVGAGLSAAGAAFQGVFRNPLVSPYILGVASGAGFGASIAILLSDSTLMVQLSALFFGLFAVFCTYAISKVYQTAPTLVLILGGVVVGAFFSSLISLVKFVADPYEKLPAIVFWLMGSLANVNVSVLTSAGLIIVLALGILTVLSWRINILSMGEVEAQAFGVDTKRERGIIIFLCTLITAAATCLVGIIGWVGLVIPHIARLLVGPDNRKLIPACISIGACYLLLVDTMARVVSEVEIPLGILTASIGAPFFAYLIMKKKVGW